MMPPIRGDPRKETGEDDPELSNSRGDFSVKRRDEGDAGKAVIKGEHSKKI